MPVVAAPYTAGWGVPSFSLNDRAPKNYEAEKEEELDEYGNVLRQNPVWKRSQEVLDTWFSSALWPHSTMGWPDDTPELKKFYPTTTLITSRDIITLWVARMVIAGLYNLGEVPFREVYITGMVRKPGTFVLDPGMTVQQAIALAGGLNERGSDRRLRVRRLVNGKLTDLSVTLVDQVRPGDTLTIASRFF